MIYLLCTTRPLLQRIVCCMSPWDINPYLFTSFFWISFHSHFCRADVWMPVAYLYLNVVSDSLTISLSLTHTCMLIFTVSVTAWCEKRENDSSSLERERPPCSVFYCVFSCSSALAPSPHQATPSSPHFVPRFVSPQIPMLWGSTALTTPWSEEWWLSWSLSPCV